MHDDETKVLTVKTDDGPTISKTSLDFFRFTSVHFKKIYKKDIK